MNRYFPTLVLFGLLLASVLTDWYSQLAIILSIVVLLMLINKLGKGIVLMETIAFLYVYTCVFMPYIGYQFYGKSDPLSFLWKRFMPVKEATYFSFVLPACTLFCLLLSWPIRIQGFRTEYDFIQTLKVRIERSLKGKEKIGIVIMTVGLLMFWVYPFVPGSFQFFFFLIYFSSFAGLLYIYYSAGLMYRYWFILGFSLFILINALNSGMFTIVAYMSLTIFSFFFLGRQTSLLKKLVIFLLGFSLFIVLQNTKKAYRFYTWGKSFEGSKVTLFTDLFIENVIKGDALVQKDAFFPVYMRTNQGYNIALVMKKFPHIYPHDNGQFLVTNIASSVVPRFLWPDKPEAGGRFNMKYYTGWTINKWSTNIGPLGEAYGAFGVIGGIFYMGFLGLFIRWVYVRLFYLSYNLNPLLICWLPVLFYQVTYSAETDTLQIVNALLKTSFFIWLLYNLKPDWFAVKRKRIYPGHINVALQSHG